MRVTSWLRWRARAASWVLGLSVALLPLLAFAQRKRGGGSGEALNVAKDAFTDNSFASRPLILIVALAALSLVPFVLMMVTSFVKISVVLSIVRSALGTQQIPPTQVITGLAIILTVYIMSPVGAKMYDVAELEKFRGSGGVLSAQTVDAVMEAAQKAKEPLRDFMLKKIKHKDRALFYGLALKMRGPEARKDLSDKDFLIITPAFVVSELKEAFQIGFLLFVPFIVIDMVVANILLALGMHMLSPTTISLPFKLLLFVLVDGWYLIAKGLVVGYL